MRRSRVVVDSHATVMAKSGGVLLAIAEGAITEDDVRTELGARHRRYSAGRTYDDDITLFESVGVGLQDLATAELVIARAEELGVGVRRSTSEPDPRSGGILETVDSVLHFAGNFWWLIFPLGGVIGGGVRAVAAANERRAERRLERYRIKQQTKIAVAEASGRGKVDEAAARRELTKVLAAARPHRRALAGLRDGRRQAAGLPADDRHARAADRRSSTRPAAAPTCCGPRPPTTCVGDRDAQLDYRDAVHDYVVGVRRGRGRGDPPASQRLLRRRRRSGWNVPSVCCGWRPTRRRRRTNGRTPTPRPSASSTG